MEPRSFRLLALGLWPVALAACAEPGPAVARQSSPASGEAIKLAHSGHRHASGSGTVNSVDAAGHKLNISHGPMPAIGWPSMTMDFAVAPTIDLGAIQPGIRVNFTIEQGTGGTYVIQSIRPAGVGQQ